MADQEDRKAFGFRDIPWQEFDLDDIGGDTTQFAKFAIAADEESDRGLVLITTSYLDEMLRRSIAGMLVDESIAKSLLNGAVAPLGTFSARIKAAYGLGIIDKLTQQDFDRLRTVRNQFAHQFDMSFEDQKVRDCCSKLSAPGRDGQPLTGTAREIFSFAAISYALILGFRLSRLRFYKLRTIKWVGQSSDE